AQLVILAAGAVQSPMLLQKSGLGMQSGLLGHNLFLNPFISMVGRFPQAVYGWRGALTGVYVDQFLGPHDGQMFMMSGLPEPVQLLSTGGLGVGKSHMQFMGDYRYYAMLQVFVQDEGQGYVHWTGDPVLGAKHIEWNLSQKNFEDFKQGIARAARIFFAAGAEAVLLPTFDKMEVTSVFELDKSLEKVEYAPMGMYSLRVASLNPQGTCRMGMDPFTSVVNDVCELHDTHGIFVTDASVLPESVTVSPKMTIAAVASYVADYIVKNKKSYFWS
ncbi:MAG: GMC family oxidoreductase, partial [Pseudomonadales bacterium]|nr:GMC family oxidoreductase [Pseudomonadales bacterium]